MKFPTSALKAEQIIWFYIKTRGDNIRSNGNWKIENQMIRKCKSLGIGISQAWIYVRQARELGIIDEAIRMEVLQY